MTGPHSEPRLTPRQRIPGVPQVDVMQGAAAEQLVLTVHVDVPSDYVVRDGFKGEVAAAIQAVAFPAAAPADEIQA